MLLKDIRIFILREFSFFPNEFGNEWSELTLIDLSDNQLTSLPNGFGTTWSYLTKIGLDTNQRTSKELWESVGINRN